MKIPNFATVVKFFKEKEVIKMPDPYDDLFVDEQEPKEKIASAIKKFISFSKTGEVLPTEGYAALNGQQRVLLCILASKVLVSKKLREQEGYRTGEIAKFTGIPIQSIEGYVYGQLKKYVQSDAGRIFIPNYRVIDVIQKLNTKDADNDDR